MNGVLVRVLPSAENDPRGCRSPATPLTHCVTTSSLEDNCATCPTVRFGSARLKKRDQTSLMKEVAAHSATIYTFQNHSSFFLTNREFNPAADLNWPLLMIIKVASIKCCLFASSLLLYKNTDQDRGTRTLTCPLVGEYVN